MSNKLLSPTGESASTSLIDLVDEGLKLRQELKDVLADAKMFMEGDSDSHHQQQQQQQGQQHNQSQHPKQQLGSHMYRRTRASQWPLGGPHSPTNSIVSTTSSLEMRANQMRLMNASRMGTSFLPANESKSLSTRYPPTSKNNRIMSTPLNHVPKQEEMSRRDNMKRIFVGNLPPDVRSRDIDDLFYKFGKIAFIDLKTRRGPPFAFVEFQDYRDAEEAVKARDGKKFDGYRLRVEFPRGRERPSRFKNGGSGSHRSGVPTQKHSKYRVKVSNLPASGSWQDLKDHMREIGEVCFADVYKNGEGVVEFVSYDDMRYAIRKLNDTKFKSHEGESSYIKLREDIPSRSRSRSRTPTDRSRSRIKSRSRSPVYNKSPVRSYRKSSGESRSRSRSRTPRSGGRSKSRSYSNSMSGSPARDKSPAVRSNGPHGRSRSPRDRSRSASKSHSRSSSHDRSIHDSPHSARSRSPRSNSRTPTPVEEKD